MTDNSSQRTTFYNPVELYIEVPDRNTEEKVKVFKLYVNYIPMTFMNCMIYVMLRHLRKKNNSFEAFASSLSNFICFPLLGGYITLFWSPYTTIALNSALTYLNARMLTYI